MLISVESCTTFLSSSSLDSPFSLFSVNGDTIPSLTSPLEELVNSNTSVVLNSSSSISNVDNETAPFTVEPPLGTSLEDVETEVIVEDTFDSDKEGVVEGEILRNGSAVNCLVVLMERVLRVDVDRVVVLVTASATFGCLMSIVDEICEEIFDI